MNSVLDHPKGGVAPFGNPRIKECSPLPAAYRSVPRPSSPLSAKASTGCPYLTLDRETSRTGTSPARDAPRRHSGMTTIMDPPNMADRIEAIPLGHTKTYSRCQTTPVSLHLRDGGDRTWIFPTTSELEAPGGGKRDRTDDLLLAKQALSQLSYAPVPGSELSDVLIGKGCAGGGSGNRRLAPAC